jgi:hypothetical protein
MLVAHGAIKPPLRNFVAVRLEVNDAQSLISFFVGRTRAAVLVLLLPTSWRAQILRIDPIALRPACEAAASGGAQNSAWRN